MPPSGPDKTDSAASGDELEWLTRLDAPAWLRAAKHELVQAYDALERKHQRQGVTHARRAAGMAWNAVLRVRFDASYGRSYMEHLARLRDDGAIAADVREAARALIEAPLQVELVQLGPGSVVLAEVAKVIVVAAERVLGGVEVA